MNERQSGYEFLKRLQKENADHKVSFDQFSEFLEAKARKNGIPYNGLFELTPLCNFSCKMCYVHLTGEQIRGHSILPPDEWKKLMYQAWTAGMMEASLTGGECLTYPGFDDVYLFLQSLGCGVILLTNGALLDKTRVVFLQKYKPANMQVTLYGGSDDAYERVTGQRAFGVVKENIQRAMDAGLRLVINITPSKYLGEDVFETIRVAKELCPNVTINSSLFTPREETGRSTQDDNPDLEMYAKVFRMEKELSGKTIGVWEDMDLPEPGNLGAGETVRGVKCGAGRSCFTIDWQGDMYACNRLRMIHAKPMDVGFQEAWKSVNQQAENWVQEPACNGCPYEDICLPCAGNVHRFAQPGGRPEEWCKRTLYFVRHGIWDAPKCT
jgi:radical SAM protein with 4Fe4S-binding SPASM domain